MNLMPRREPPLRPGRKEKSVVNLWPWNMRKISNFLLLSRESFRLFFLIENLNFVVFGFPLELFGIKSRRILWAREHNVCASGYAIKLATEKRKLKKNHLAQQPKKSFEFLSLMCSVCRRTYEWIREQNYYPKTKYSTVSECNLLEFSFQCRNAWRMFIGQHNSGRSRACSFK